MTLEDLLVILVGLIVLCILVYAVKLVLDMLELPPPMRQLVMLLIAVVVLIIVLALILGGDSIRIERG